MWKCGVINTPLCEFKLHPNKQLARIYFSTFHFFSITSGRHLVEVSLTMQDPASRFSPITILIYNCIKICPWRAEGQIQDHPPDRSFKDSGKVTRDITALKCHNPEKQQRLLKKLTKSCFKSLKKGNQRLGTN